MKLDYRAEFHAHGPILSANNTWSGSNGVDSLESTVIIVGGNNTGRQTNWFTDPYVESLTRRQINGVLIVEGRNVFN